MTLPALPSSPAQERPAAAARAGGGATNPGAAGNPCVLLPALAPNVITVGATSPASKGVGGFLAMTEERERELMRQVHTIRSTAEMDGFRAATVSSRRDAHGGAVSGADAAVGEAEMIRRLLALFRRPDPRDAMFARRGQRVNNRKPEAARAYERVHLILARGPKC